MVNLKFVLFAWEGVKNLRLCLRSLASPIIPHLGKILFVFNLSFAYFSVFVLTKAHERSNASVALKECEQKTVDLAIAEKAIENFNEVQAVKFIILGTMFVIILVGLAVLVAMVGGDSPDAPPPGGVIKSLDYPSLIDVSMNFLERLMETNSLLPENFASLISGLLSTLESFLL
jgi:hypothetical protein